MSETPDLSKLTQPYPGLRPFHQDEASLFFGRANEINRMRACLEDNRFLAVVGGSGSGKSSLVRAGLLPVLEQGYLLGAGTNWRFVVMRPGGDPFRNLAAEFHRAVAEDSGLPDPGDIAFTQATLQTSPRGFLEVVAEAGLAEGVPLLLLVDQFEEVFRFRRRHAGGAPAGDGQRAIHHERNEATAFVNLLLTTSKAAAQAELPIYVVITMRSDFIGDCEVFPNLPQAVSDSQFLVPRMSRRQMQEVIEKPLLLFGWKAGSGLVNQILNDTGTALDQLPLMQHALMRTWFAAQERSNRGDQEKTLTLIDYDGVGRFADALSQHLEEAWDSLADDRERRIAQQLFLCLSERSGEGALIRRMVKLSEVAAVASADPGEVIKVVRVFQEEERSFIVASPHRELSADSVLDISHEALLRQWPRLRSWLDEEEDSVAEYLRLADRAHRWKAGDGELLPGRELQRAQEWQESRRPTAAWAERYCSSFAEAIDYLAASQTAEENRHRRAKKHQLLLRGTVTIVLVVFAALTVWAFAEQKEAQGQKRIAEDERQKAQSLEGMGWMSRAQLAAERGRGIRYPDTLFYAARSIGFDGLGRPDEELPELPRLIRKESNPADYQEARTWIRDRPNYLPVWSSALRKSPVTGLALSPTGRYLAISAEDGSVRLWNFSAGEEIEVCPASGKPVNDVAFHPDGTLLAVAEATKVRFWAVEARSFDTKREYRAEVSVLAYSPGGQVLAGAAVDGSILFWKDEQAPSRFETKQIEPATQLAFSSDDSTLAVVYPDGALELIFHYVEESHGAWKNAAEEGLYEGVTAVAFSPDGTRLAIGAKEGGVGLWDVTRAENLGKVTPRHRHDGAVLDLSFSPDGKQLASASADRTIRLWDVASDEPDLVATLAGHTNKVSEVTYVPGGGLLASASVDGSAKLWNVSGRTGSNQELYPYLERKWYIFDPESQEAVWKNGEGFIDLPADSVVGFWKRPEGERKALFARFMETKNWTAAVAVVQPRDLLGRAALVRALLADAREAADQYRWSRVRLRLGQLKRLEKLRRIDGPVAARIAEIGKMMAKVAVETIPFTNGDGMELVWCPAGTFQMGSPPEPEDQRKPYDWLKHEVTLSQGFWIAKHEVSQGEYKAITGVNPSSYPKAPEEASDEIKKDWTKWGPVENVSWEDAVEFCRTLTDRERARGALPQGWEYNLPTEAQWEYACRAGTDTLFSFGDDRSQLHKYANFSDVTGEFAETADMTQNDGYKNTSPRGIYQPNRWSLYDMHGNVWEWCRDAFDPENKNFSRQPVTDPLGTDGPYKLQRGGCYYDAPEHCRSAIRDGIEADYRSNDIGIRVVLVRTEP